MSTKRNLPSGTFDWALPINWVRQVRALVNLGDRRCSGNIVWDYSGSNLFGKPFAATPEGESILADYYEAIL